MAPEKREWSVPGPIRALLWWPGVAFVLVMVAPDSAAVGIAVSGAVLMVLGAIVPMVSRRLRSPRPARVVDAPTVEMPTVEIPPVERVA